MLCFSLRRISPSPSQKEKTKRIIIVDFFQNFQSIFEHSNLEYAILIRFKFSLVTGVHYLSENPRPS